MTLTPKELEIKERCEKATEGPWSQVFEDDFCEESGKHLGAKPALAIEGPWYTDYPHQVRDTVCVLGFTAHSRHQENLNFIAHAREDVPILLETISTLREENRKLEKALEQVEKFGVFELLTERESIFMHLPIGERGTAIVVDCEDVSELAEFLRKRSENSQRTEQTATQPASTNQEGVSPGAKQL